MNRDQKAAVIDEVAAQISESEAVFAVDYRGISVPQAAELRTKLIEAGAPLQRRQEHADRARRRRRRRRQRSRSSSKARPRSRSCAATPPRPPRRCRDFRRASGGTLLEFKGGWMNGAPLDAAQIEAIAKLPSREVLYGRLVGMVASPLTGLVTRAERPDRRPRPPAAADRRPGPGAAAARRRRPRPAAPRRRAEPEAAAESGRRRGRRAEPRLRPRRPAGT